MKERNRIEKMAMGKWWKIGVVVAVIGIVRELSKQYGWDKDAGIKVLGEWSDRLGVWAMPVFIGVHTLTLALCLPYAVFFEAASSLLFGFFPAVLCVFLAKLLGASLSFWIGRFFSFCLTFNYFSVLFIIDLLMGLVITMNFL